MSFRFSRINFNGDPNVGLYGFASDKYCMIGSRIQPNVVKTIGDTLGTDVIQTSVCGSEFAGLFGAGNSNGIIFSRSIEDFEVKRLKEMGINFTVLKANETAVGNLILCNDKGCIISDLIKKYKNDISDALGCEAETAKIAGLDIVGSCAIASNIGCLCHREATEEELKRVEEILKVKADLGSVTYGTPYIRSGMLVNSKGAVVSEPTTGAELGRIEEVFKNE